MALWGIQSLLVWEKAEYFFELESSNITCLHMLGTLVLVYWWKLIWDFYSICVDAVFLLYLPCHRTYKGIWNLCCNLHIELKTWHLFSNIKTEILLRHLRSHIENLTMVTLRTDLSYVHTPSKEAWVFWCSLGKFSFFFFFFGRLRERFSHTFQREPSAKTGDG